MEISSPDSDREEFLLCFNGMVNVGGGGDEDRRQMWSGVWVVIEFQRVSHSKLSTVSHEDYYAFSVFTNLKIMRYLVSPKKSQKHLGSLK